MDRLLTAAQMRALEHHAMASGAVTGPVLMERAARAVVEAILADRRAPRPAPGPGGAWVVVICGPGNNGGDGYVIARLLAGQGWDVTVYGMGEADALPPDAAAARRAWAAVGEVRPLLDPARPRFCAGFGPRLLIDAGFGTGLSRPLPERLAHTWDWHASFGQEVFRIAVDAPSGLCLDSGRILGRDPSADAARHERPRRVLPADLTVTFHAAKIGHYLDYGPTVCGRLVVADIGLDAALDEGGPDLEAPEADTPQRDDPTGVSLIDGRMVQHCTAIHDRRAPARSLHKYDRGHVLVLAGGVARGGAARLAARAALRIGAGLVTLGCPPGALIAQRGLPDAIMLRAVAGPADLVAWEGVAKLRAICLGPGFGLGPDTRAMVAAVCGLGVPVVLDADALTAFADDPAALCAVTHGAVVLTPHLGEFARLFPDLADRLGGVAPRGPAWSKLDAARVAADRTGAVVLLKGADTVIAAPGGAAWVHAAAYDRATPGLATAGAGDVLAGMISGLLARGLAPEAAASVAAWAHVEAARRFGPGLIADDLPEGLPAVLRDLAPPPAG